MTKEDLIHNQNNAYLFGEGSKGERTPKAPSKLTRLKKYLLSYVDAVIALFILLGTATLIAIVFYFVLQVGQ